MMLFEPSPGQATDRMTILKLKIDKSIYSGTKSHDSPIIVAASREHSACLNYLDKFISTIQPEVQDEYYKLLKLLSTQNALQWQYEDAVRVAIKACSDPPTYDQLVEVMTIQKLSALGNERRATLVKEIDLLFLVEPEIKIYK